MQKVVISQRFLDSHIEPVEVSKTEYKFICPVIGCRREITAGTHRLCQSRARQHIERKHGENNLRLCPSCNRVCHVNDYNDKNDRCNDCTEEEG